MKRGDKFYFLGLGMLFLLSGCVVRTYPLQKDRVDQDLNIGNRGYLKGQAPAINESERKKTRATQVVEIEMFPPIRFEKARKIKPQETPSMQVETFEEGGNRGYITQSSAAEINESGASFEKYTVQKGDTLQKISQKFYGTTKKWSKIYEANKDTMKGPNKIYPGQVIDIPRDSSMQLLEPKENLK
ncbi:MAG: LysM peptidoglycan-binding domain-containing protein [Candidatus Omnitrophica bacterium]|nr:LysM peptidoglycan-binding domain-containing protein [Candidatus Omnitrophota bacterium]MDD5237734.1 LysM peptidoglycan-binding domain-containing protein [Candidatus Omnitrophota bacterium]